MLSNIDELIKAETARAIKEVLDGSLTKESSDDERAKQKHQSDIIIQKMTPKVKQQ